MPTPMIVPPPDETSDRTLWDDLQSAAYLLALDPRYVVVDLGPDGLPQVRRDEAGAYFVGKARLHALAVCNPNDRTRRPRDRAAVWLAIDAAMHAPAPVDPAVDAVRQAMVGKMSVQIHEAETIAEIVAAVCAADGQAR